MNPAALPNQPSLAQLLRPGDQARMERAEVRKRIVRHIVLLISLLLAATCQILQSSLPKDPEPYHTSTLSGQEWVSELIVGHPERIRCELGVGSSLSLDGYS
jgi:hypothetical protein